MSYEEEEQILKQFEAKAVAGQVITVKAIKAAFDKKLGRDTGRGYNEVFPTLENVIDRLCCTLKPMTPATIRSITGRYWLLSLFYNENSISSSFSGYFVARQETGHEVEADKTDGHDHFAADSSDYGIGPDCRYMGMFFHIIWIIFISASLIDPIRNKGQGGGMLGIEFDHAGEIAWENGIIPLF